MASRTKLLTELSLADLWQEVKDPATLWGDLTPEAQRALKLLLQNRMHEELAGSVKSFVYFPAAEGVPATGCSGGA